MKTKLWVILFAMLLSLILASCALHREPHLVEGETESQLQTEVEAPSETAEPAETDVGTEPDTIPAETQPDTVTLKDIYPTPMELTHKEGCADLSTIYITADPGQFAERLTAQGVTISEEGKPLMVIHRDLSAEFDYGAEDAYILKVTEAEVFIEAQTERGAYYALMTLLQLMDGTRAPLVTIKDAPRNGYRGVIEGFYGTAYTHEYRKELFAFMGENKMNAYIYAPKDDPKHRAQWRVLYSGRELDTMRDLIENANKNYVRFIYAISPGGDIDLGTGYEADLEKLIIKCEQIYHLGCRDFAIFLDDIPTLNAEGHAKLLNDFQKKFVEKLGDVNPLIAITTEYTDAFLTSYTDKIAPLIDKDIELMWTGPGVVPAAITNASLRSIIRKYDRNVFIWWNYPVNDVLVNNLYMGACEGLETTLYESITGLVANPMNQGYASLVPLFTTADYLWNPAAYQKEDSLKKACEVLMPDASEALWDFISMTCESPMNKNTDSVELKGLLDAFKQERSAENLSALKAYFERMIQGADALKNSENQNLYKEISEWVEKYRTYVVMGLAYTRMEEAYAAGKDLNTLLPLLGEYKTAEASIKSNTRLVSTYVLTPYLNTLQTRMNTLLGEGGELSFAPATPITDCDHYEDYLPKYMTDGDDSTYFWTAGTLSQASKNGVGYFGVDLGEIITVTNIYVATGVGGSDALSQGAFEYSTDNKKWTAIEQGSYKDEILIEGLNIQARYIRMRQTDRTNTNWTKVRAFEVNTTRTVVETPMITATVTTNLPTYQTYTPALTCDNNAGTFFWSAREGQVGDYIQLDLGAVVSIARISFKSGVTGHEADYIRNGELSYSVDGQSWTTLGKVNSREVVMDANVTARYFRVTVKAAQTNWITVSEFTATSDADVSDHLALDEYFVPRADLLPLQDGHLLSFFAPDDKMTEGHSLRVTVGETGKIRILSMVLPEDGVTAQVLDQNGKEIKTITLTYETSVEAPAGSFIVIPLGHGLALSEIIWN
ncbi:MAG: beta-N-acetylglucosaminidase domain-containing protein [Clostridia bacterium]|nr:beta-N-acetylglucosaminidase domain-containing protein [Clostridia bacterium]